MENKFNVKSILKKDDNEFKNNSVSKTYCELGENVGSRSNTNSNYSLETDSRGNQRHQSQSKIHHHYPGLSNFIVLF